MSDYEVKIYPSGLRSGEEGRDISASHATFTIEPPLAEVHDPEFINNHSHITGNLIARNVCIEYSDHAATHGTLQLVYGVGKDDRKKVKSLFQSALGAPASQKRVKVEFIGSSDKDD